MDKWEYTFIRGAAFEGLDSVLQRLNDLGREGWEVVTQLPGLWTLKRRLQS